MANQVIVTDSGNVQVAVSPPANVQVQISRSVIGTVANVASANFANYAGNVTVANQPNITGVGTLGNLTVANTITTLNLNVTGNLAVGNLIANSANYANFANVAYNVSGSNVSGAVNLANYATVANSVAGGNVSGAVGLATYATTANAVAGANVSGQVAYASVANSVAVANVSGIGNIAITNYDGNGSNILHGNGYWGPEIGPQSVANANYANFAGTAYSVSGANVSGAVSYATTANSVALSNVSGAGNIASLNLDGNASNILFGNGTFSAIPTVSNVANANYSNFAGTAYSVSGANVSGEVANANYASYAGNATYSDNVNPAGSNTQIQFNNGAGNLGADANLTFDTANTLFTVNGNASISQNIFAANANLTADYINATQWPAVVPLKFPIYSGNSNGVAAQIHAYRSKGTENAPEPMPVGAQIFQIEPAGYNNNQAGYAVLPGFGLGGTLNTYNTWDVDVEGSQDSWYTFNDWQINNNNKYGNGDHAQTQVTFHNDNLIFGGFNISQGYGPLETNPTIVSQASNGSQQNMVFSSVGNLTIPASLNSNEVHANYLYGDGSNISNVPTTLGNSITTGRVILNPTTTEGAPELSINGDSSNVGHIRMTQGSFVINNTDLGGGEAPFSFGIFGNNSYQEPMNYSRSRGDQNTPLDCVSGDYLMNQRWQARANGSVQDMFGTLTTYQGYTSGVGPYGNYSFVSYGDSANTHIGFNAGTLDFTSNNSIFSGNINSANANLGNLASANYFTGTLTTNAQPNITSTGNLVSLTINNGNVELPTKQFNPNGITVGTTANVNLMAVSSFVDVDYGNGQGGSNLALGKSTTYVKARGNSSSIATAALNDRVGRTNYMFYNGTSNLLGVSTHATSNGSFNANSNGVTTGGSYVIFTGNPSGDQGNANALSSLNAYVFDAFGRMTINPGAAAGAGSILNLVTYGTSNGNSTLAQSAVFSRYRGNRDSTLSVQANDQLGTFSFIGYNGTSQYTARTAGIQATVDSSYVTNASVILAGFKLATAGASSQNDNWFYANGNARFGVTGGSNTTFVSGATLFVNNLDATSNANVAGNVYIGTGANLITLDSPNGYITYNRTFGDFYNASTITPAAANTPNVLPLGSAVSSQNCSVQSTSQLLISRSGNYNIQFSLQSVNADNSAEHDFWVWLRKNGSDVTNSATNYTVIKNNGKNVAMLTFNVASNGSDYFEIAYAVADTQITFPAYTANSQGFTHPAIPSLIVNVIPIGA